MHSSAPTPIFRVITAGSRTTLQDGGRPGLKGYGIPCGGAMSITALTRLNSLFNKPPHSAAWEMLWGGVTLECLHDVCMAYHGNVQATVNDEEILHEKTIFVHCGDIVRFIARGNGLWSYFTIGGEWAGPSWFGSQSVWPEGGMGNLLQTGDVLCCAQSSLWQPPAGIAARYLTAEPPYTESIRVHMGPQWENFSPEMQQQFFATSWRISLQCSRAGYRLEGPALDAPVQQLLSEPIIVGSIQVPPTGQPIVLLNDGPTIGGYHKIGVIAEGDLDHFRQMPPGTTVNFSLES